MTEKIAVFTVLIADRHADAEVEVWATEPAAVARARSEARDMCVDLSDLDEGVNEAQRAAGVVYYCRYSPEGDYVSVSKTYVQFGADSYE